MVLDPIVKLNYHLIFHIQKKKKNNIWQETNGWRLKGMTRLIK
jgi:hypothetical protein